MLVDKLYGQATTQISCYASLEKKMICPRRPGHVVSNFKHSHLEAQHDATAVTKGATPSETVLYE